MPLPARVQALLLDRDGTLNVERRDYVRTPEQLQMLDGALEAMARIAAWNLPVVVITNQSCVGRGLVTQATLDAVHARLSGLVTAAGGRIDAILACTHAPDAGCTCRKPQPGLLHQAAARFGLSLRSCLFVGDSVTDLQAADAAGCPAIHVATGLAGTAGAGCLHTALPNLAAVVDLLEARGAVAAPALASQKER